MAGNRKLGRTTDHRMAMLRAMVTYLLDNGSIETTVTRAREVRPLAEKMITLGKKNTLASRRKAMAFITKEEVVAKTFNELAEKDADRTAPRRQRGDGYYRAGISDPLELNCKGDCFEFDAIGTISFLIFQKEELVMETDWLREMMRISGVPEETEEDNDLPYIPGMLPQTSEEEREAERRFRFQTAELQTIHLIEEQEMLRGTPNSGDEDDGNFD